MSAALALMTQTTEPAALQLGTCTDGLFDILQASVSAFERQKVRMIPAAALFAKTPLAAVKTAAGSGRAAKRYFFKINGKKTSEKHLFIVGKIIGRW